MEYTFGILTERIKLNGKSYDMGKIGAAYSLAEHAHKGQKRQSGEPYISHPIAVAVTLAEMRLDISTICAALLHDVVEDTDISLEDIELRFGEDVARLVDGVTKIERVSLDPSIEEEKAENLRKILLSMTKDARVILIKLADRLHNMRTLGFTSVKKQKKVALETLTFYAPIAHRIGVSQIKDELEDLSLRYLDPYAYREIEEKLKGYIKENEGFIERIKAIIEKCLNNDSTASAIPFVIEARIKSIYSIYKKTYMVGANLDLNLREIFDIYALRLIIDTNFGNVCYNFLAPVYDMFTPLQNRFKDYINSPKANGYQSLHTTVASKEGTLFEVQIRTEEMHRMAQHGVAAHWRYKTGASAAKKQGEGIEWVREFVEHQQEADDFDYLSEAIKTDLSPDDVHVFTPNTDVIILPSGSTVVDFAYKIHKAIAERMSGAKVHGRIVKYDYVLKDGDIVEIITSKTARGPNRSWLDYAYTNAAKSKIRSWLKREHREENIIYGKGFIESELKRNNIETDTPALTDLAARHRFSSLDDFYAAVGYGAVATEKIKMWMRELLILKESKESRESVPIPEVYISEIRKEKQSRGVIVEGIDGIKTKYAQCCNPLPGDAIIGFVTRGYGVSVHKKECPNAPGGSKNLSGDGDRWVKVTWAEGINEKFPVTLEVTATDRNALLSDVTAVISGNHISIIESGSRRLKNGNAIVIVTVEVAGADQLNNIMVKLQKVRDVISVERTGK